MDDNRLDEIDQLVDEQLTHTPDDYSNPYSERCPRCKRAWHGLPQANCDGPFGKPDPLPQDALMGVKIPGSEVFTDYVRAASAEAYMHTLALIESIRSGFQAVTTLTQTVIDNYTQQEES